MKTIELSRIKIKANRQRQEFDPADLMEFGEKICETGLLHAIILRQEGEDFYLVAGERRLRAIVDLHAMERQFQYDGQLVPAGHIPYTTLGELSELEAEEAEWEENNRRVDLTWQEKAASTTRLMALRTAFAARDGAIPPSVSDIAREVRPTAAGLGGDDRQSTVVGEAQNATRQELIVAKHLHNPAVAGAKSLKEAYKILKREEEAKKHAELAASVGATFTSASHTLLQGDCLELLSTLPAATFDVILTDPPYGIGADEFGDSGRGGTEGAHFYEDSYEAWVTLMEGLIPQLARLTKPDAHAYLFCDVDRFGELKQRMTVAGWTVHRTPLVWHNPDGYRCPWPDRGPQRKYELILYAVKGGKKVTRISPDVIECRKDKQEGHPAQKPVVLLQELLRRSCRPGERVLDPCMGSGSTIVACHELKLIAAGIERIPQAFGVAARRVAALGQSEPELAL